MYWWHPGGWLYSLYTVRAKNEPRRRFSKVPVPSVYHEFSGCLSLARGAFRNGSGLDSCSVFLGSLLEELNRPGGVCLRFQPREVEEEDCS